MPWHVGSSKSCPVSKPFAVIKNADGSVAGCHPTKKAAQKQMAALYANETNALSGADEKRRTTMTDAERRFTSVPVEIRAGSDKTMTIGGYAAKFDRPSRSLGGFREQIDPVAFNNSRGDGWPGVIARYNHDDNMLLGTVGGGTLRLGTDNVGLTYDVDVPNARSDVYELVQRGDVRQSSFAFIALEDDWSQDDAGFPMRTLVKVRLMDVAPVNSPAYEDTSVDTRSIDAALSSLAQKFSADVEEVRKMAAENELIRFFKRTDKQGKPQPKHYSAQAALARVLAVDPDVTL